MAHSDNAMADVPSPPAPAVVTVGNELLYGERNNDNQTWLLHRLWELGIPARLALSLPDEIALIGAEIARLKTARFGPILVSGGIGGTHDDCTRQGIAAGLGVPLARHEECHRILSERYGERYNRQRQRMAELPRGCALIANPLGAPGFHLGGVYAFPGFPTMLKPMVEGVLAELLGDRRPATLETRDYTLPLAEGIVAGPLEAFSQAHPQLSIGIYPSTKKLRREVTVRLRYAPADKALADELGALLRALRPESPAP